MTPAQFLPIIAHAAPLLARYDTPAARCLLLAIAGQESEWSRRLQVPVPYARGFWQCEKNGAVLAVTTGEATRPLMVQICQALCIPTGLDQVFEAVAWCDDLAYCVARLALLPDPAPLPAIGDAAGAWDYYLRVWAPGTPRPESWPDRYGAAAALMTTPATAGVA
ncbi:MAG TPA: hypothetical protein VK741_25685 [Acetobacteraceae bacterium]|jgi:hypothetical protein|nr:hypothetical protein [Acetobacteraceae bacterium]